MFKKVTLTDMIYLVCFVMLFTLYGYPKVISGSMEGTIKTNDRVLLDLTAYGIVKPWSLLSRSTSTVNRQNIFIKQWGHPKRGDIVIFNPPIKSKAVYTKRCVALAGDEVSIQGKDFYLKPHEGESYIKKNFPKKSIVTIDKELWVKNPYQQFTQHTGNKDKSYKFCSYLQRKKISKGRCFALGDNRDNSYDSRYWGSIPYQQIYGRVSYIVASI